MKSLNYITNLNLLNVSGGGSGVNYATHNQLKKYFNLNYVGPVNLPFDKLAKLKSNILRSFCLRGNYHFFSEKRLIGIKNAVSASVKQDVDFNFFHGTTSWIKFKSKIPYFAYTDACFATYVEVFNNKTEFSKTDLHRIYDAEANWMNNARKVFFRSKWALEETKKKYGLKGDNLFCVGLGGFMNIPLEDTHKGEKVFLFISKEFKPKGGTFCLEAFKKLLQKFPYAKLVIIGDAPPSKEIENINNIQYAGFLDKNNPHDLKKFEDYVSQAFALIHPTNKDTNALVITEVGYFGCPSIASNSFAIPEFIEDSKTGLLLDNPLDIEEIYNKMCFLLENEDYYLKMRANVRRFTTENSTWDKVSEKLYKQISESLLSNE